MRLSYVTSTWTFQSYSIFVPKWTFHLLAGGCIIGLPTLGVSCSQLCSDWFSLLRWPSWNFVTTRLRYTSVALDMSFNNSRRFLLFSPWLSFCASSTLGTARGVAFAGILSSFLQKCFNVTWSPMATNPKLASCSAVSSLIAALFIWKKNRHSCHRK